jgi:hypothetical protein
VAFGSLKSLGSRSNAVSTPIVQSPAIAELVEVTPTIQAKKRRDTNVMVDYLRSRPCATDAG